MHFLYVQNTLTKKNGIIGSQIRVSDDKVQRYDVKPLIRENWKFSWPVSIRAGKNGRIKPNPAENQGNYQIFTGNT